MDSRVPLAAALPPEPEQKPDLELVTVLETGDLIPLSAAKAELEEAGIGVRLGYTPHLIPSHAIQVAREYAATAREILEDLPDSAYET